MCEGRPSHPVAKRRYQSTVDQHEGTLNCEEPRLPPKLHIQAHYHRKLYHQQQQQEPQQQYQEKQWVQQQQQQLCQKQVYLHCQHHQGHLNHHQQQLRMCRNANYQQQVGNDKSQQLRHLQEKKNRLLQRLQELREWQRCVVCMDADIGVVFVPCAHLVACRACAASLASCPICRATIHHLAPATLH